MATFSDQDVGRIRHHLGYPGVSTLAGIYQGSPIPLQTVFLVDSAIQRVMAVRMDYIRGILQDMDLIECQIRDARTYMVVDQMGEMKIRTQHVNQLRSEYAWWADVLANEFGVPVYAFSRRMRGPGINVRVS